MAEQKQKPASSGNARGKKISSASKKVPSKTANRKSTTKKVSSAITEKVAQKQKKQRRDMWTVGFFIVFILTLLATFGMDGFILQPVGQFLRGLFGVGSYILPFACLGASIALLFSRGEPVLGKIISIFIIPLTFGMLEHMIFSTLNLKDHFITGLYSSGIVLASGGLISGGITLILSAAISKIGALLVVSVLLIGTVLYLCNIRISNVLDFILDSKDKYDERRSMANIDDEYFEEYSEKPAPLIVKNEIKEPLKSREECNPTVTEYGDVRQVKRRIDIPLSPIPDEDNEDDEDEQEISPPIRTTTAPGMKIADIAPSVAKFNFGIQRTHDTDEVDMEEKICLTPIRRKSDYDDLPFDLDDEPQPIDSGMKIESPIEAAPKTEAPENDEIFRASEIFAPKPEVPVEAAKKEEKSEAPELPQNLEIHDTHHEKVETLGEKALKPVHKGISYPFPSVDFLNKDKGVVSSDATEELRSRSQKLNDTLNSFGIEAKIINVTRGPSVTRYEMQLDRGVKLSRLTSLQDDIALSLGATSVRIAPIPDKSAVGIEVPNKIVQTVVIRDVLTSREMSNMKSKIAFAIGKDITGTCMVGDIGKMPHMLIAGTTGSGKSVCINSIIVSILYRATPDEVKLIMIDPKMVELGNYNGIPHLLIPVVTDYKKASGALNWAVVEMERRYKLLSETGARDLVSYNKIAEQDGDVPLPQIVIIIDELADLMMTAAKEVEESICRIAQKARAAGMHLIIATQRPSADVLTGLMKSNIPSRIAFTVSSQMESRIILDTGGAEKLIGRGDMLYSPIGMGKPLRVQGCFLSSEEIEKVVDFIKQSGTAEYSQEILDHIENSLHDDKGAKKDDTEDDTDEMYFEAVDVVIDTKQASASMLQRRLKLGYARAARIIDQMEARGIIGSYEGSKPRAILISKTDWQEMKLRRFD